MPTLQPSPVAPSRSCRPIVRVGYSRGFQVNSVQGDAWPGRRSGGPCARLARLGRRARPWRPRAPGAGRAASAHWRAAPVAPYPGESLEVLARPVDVHAAGDAVPLLIRCLGAALRTTHGHHPGQAFFQGSSRSASYRSFIGLRRAIARGAARLGVGRPSQDSISAGPRSRTGSSSRRGRTPQPSRPSS